MKSLIICIVCVLGLFRSDFAFANSKLLASGELGVHQVSDPIDVSSVTSVVIGIKTGEIICGSPIRPALLQTFFQMGSDWYEQGTCYTSGGTKCSVEALQTNSIVFKPSGPFIRVATAPVKYDNVPVNCSGSVHYEVWGL